MKEILNSLRHSVVLAHHWIVDGRQTSSLIKLDPLLGNYANLSRIALDHIRHI